MAWDHNMNPHGPVICCLYRLNIWSNILDPVSKIHVVKRMKVNSNKVICTDFCRNVMYDCRYDHDDIPLVYPTTNLPPFQL